MGKRTNCCVPDCCNVRGKVPIAYYRIPKHPHRRRKRFIQLIGRDWRWKPNENTRICATHFVNGVKSDNPESDSYLPSLNLPFLKKPAGIPRSTKTATRKDTVTDAKDANPLYTLCEAVDIRLQQQQQQHRKAPPSTAPTASNDNVPQPVAELAKELDPDRTEPPGHKPERETLSASALDQSGSKLSSVTNTVDSSRHLDYFDHDYAFGHRKMTLNLTDYEEVTHTIKKLRETNARLTAENTDLKSKCLTIDLIKSCEETCLRYTGLPNYATFRALFEFLEDDAKDLVYWDGKKTAKKLPSTRRRERRRLTLEEEFFVTLVRLKLNLPLFDLSRQLGVATGHLSNTIVTWIHFLADMLEELIGIPEYADIEHVLSDKAKEFSGTRLIVDCTEWYTQRPSHLIPRKQIWSNYKHENTFKWLVGVSLKGAICYVSNAWGGRASDKCITNSCGLLDKLNPGDGLMADRGFDMETELSSRGIDLHIPAFKGSNRSQLTSPGLYIPLIWAQSVLSKNNPNPPK